MKPRARTVRPKERIYKTITLCTSRGRAWRAISEPHEFGAWFGASFGAAYHRPFEPGVTLTCAITPGAADGYVATALELTIVDVDPDHRVSFRWRPYAVDGDAGDESEPTTLVELELQTEPEGVVITVTESGFFRFPRARRLPVFAAHDEGWDGELMRLKRYLETSDPTPRHTVTVEVAA